MDFYEIIKEYKDFDFEGFDEKVTEAQVQMVLAKDTLAETDFLALLSESASKYLEQMANKAKRLTYQHFGKVILLYTPLYLANYCVNRCAYCGFNAENNIVRGRLEPSEVEKEAEVISKTGLKHILILTGESKKYSPVAYIKECIEVLKKYFSSISIEIYPLNTNEYMDVIATGWGSFPYLMRGVLGI